MPGRVILLFALFACIGCSSEDDKGGQPDAVPLEHVQSILEHFNRGVGLMERYKPVEATKAFEEVVRLAPGWSTGRLNLGLALLNSQSVKAYARAEQELKRVAAAAPENPYAHYALGMLFRHQNRLKEAGAKFARVLEIDPDDADAHYQLGALIVDQQPQVAQAHFEKTLAAIPHHESACYRLQVILRQAGEKQAAIEVLRRFKALKTSKSGVHAGMKYGEMGRYAEVIRAFDFPGDRKGTADAPPGYVDVAKRVGLEATVAGVSGFPGEDLHAIRQSGAKVFGPGLAVADVDGDGDLDVYTAGTLYLNSSGRFLAAPDPGIDGRDAVGAWFGDYDGDGDPDLYLTCAGANRLYQNQRKGRFVDVTEATGTGGGALLSVGAAWADADHDGDLDLYVANFCAWPLAEDQAAGAANALWRNNRNGTFTDVAAEAGIDGGDAATISVLYLDADDDRDLDLYLVNHRSRNRLFLNDRVGHYSKGTEYHAILEDDGPGSGALLGDIDQNGWEDLLLLRGPEPPRLFLQTSRGRFAEDEAFTGAVQVLGGVIGGVLGDLDLDGDLDLVLHHHILMNRGGGRFASAVVLAEGAEAGLRAAVAADFDADGCLELLAPPCMWRSDPPPDRHWLEVIPTGKATVGMQVELKTGALLQLRRLVSSSGYLSGPPLRAHFGLGAHPKGDYVRLVWPDAMLQSELEVAADQSWRVKKVRRKPSSCPLLFCWNGERFAFVSDFLGVGGLGFFVAPGEYAPPDPTEDLRIPPGLVATKDGRYLLRIAEPLEEVSYLDELELRVYDHPASVELHPDERFAESEPWPTGRPHAVAKKIFPVAARTDREDTVLPSLLEIDRLCVEPPKDPRFVGYAREHWCELDFGDQLRELDKDCKLVLYLYGWVEYTYSHVNYAAWQAGLTMRSPSIEVPDGKGGWRTAMPAMGFPAGLPRMMTLDVSSLPIAESGKLRIRSTMEIFWDQIFLAEDVPVPGLALRVLHPKVAELRPIGYPREYSPDGRDPTLYDYDRLDGGLAFKNLTGDYTRYGDVRPLLEAVDDRFVIMGKGEEIALEFDASELPPLPKGWQRTVVLHSDGYCKDMDLYTAFPDTVEPLPWHGMKNYPPAKAREEDEELKEYRRTWNIRRVVGR